MAVTVLVSLSGAGAALAAGPIAYIANERSSPSSLTQTVSLLDTSTNTVTGVVTVGNGPVGVAVTPDGTKAYVANFGQHLTSSVSVISGGAVTATIAMGDGSVGVAISPDGTKAYVTNQQAQTLSVISTATDTITTTIALSGAPSGVVVSPSGAHIYVSDSSSTGHVFDITASTSAVVTISGVVGNPNVLEITPDGTKLYAGGAGTSVINPATDAVTATISSTQVQGFAVSADSSRLFLTRSDGAVVAIKTSDNSVASTLATSLSGTPEGIAITPDGTKLYIPLNGVGVGVVPISSGSLGASTTITDASFYFPDSFGRFIQPAAAAPTPPAAPSVPTLSEWTLGLFAAAVTGAGLVFARQRRLAQDLPG